MSEKDEQEEKGFKVRDKRRFSMDGDDAVKETAEESAKAQSLEEKAEPEGEQPAAEPVQETDSQEEDGADEDKKKGLRERIMDKLSGKDKEEQAPGEDQQEGGLPEIDFLGFVFSLSTSAMMHFGDMEDPASGKKTINLVAAKQTIDILGMLEEKTKGNLSEQEEKFLSSILYDLRMRFISTKQKGS